MARWIKATKGVRYREHETRKHGAAKDKYYAIYYRVNGKQIEEGLGWASEGWTVDRAVETRAELSRNRRNSEGPRTLKEKAAIKKEEYRKKAERAEQEAKDRLTFKELAEGDYNAYCESYPTKRTGLPKTEQSINTEKGYLENWIYPAIGSLPLPEIAPIHIQKIKSDMTKDKKAARSIRYALAIIRQVFNYAIKHELFNGPNPIAKVDMPGGDNRRLRFLTREDADALLAKLATISPDVRDMAALSLFTGMRAGEIFKLTWQDVDIDRGILTLRNTKSGHNRKAFMTESIREIFRQRERGLPTELVFPDRTGRRMARISNTFARAVDALKLNEGIKDRLQRICFHSLRHSYASWHVENGTDLFIVKELLGHSDFKLTSRYSHLGDNILQAAVKRLDSTLQAPGKVIELVKKG